MLSILLQNLLSFSRKSDFRILDIQIAWCHQMPKHKTRNTFYWITCEVNCWCLFMKFGYLCHITREKELSKNSAVTATWKAVPGPFVFAKN